MDPAAERELVRRCQEGSDAAFREIVEAYQAAVFAAITTGRPSGDAEQLAEDVFVRLYRGMPYARPQAGLAPWLSRLVVGAGGADGLAAPSGPVRVPPGFADRVHKATRRDWLRSEEQFDWWFNAGIGIAIVATILGLWYALNTTGFDEVVDAVIRQLAGRQ